MIVLSVVNMKGGVAKTTIAINIAHVLARREGYKVLVVDADPQFNATQCLLGGDEYVAHRDEGHTIVDIFDDETRVIISPVRGEIVRHSVGFEDIVPYNIEENYDLIPGNLDLYRLDTRRDEGRVNRLKLYADTLRQDENYDYLIIDTPPTPSIWMTSALLASDFYIIPVKPEPLSTTGIDLLKGVVDRTMRNCGYEIACIGVILTMAERRTRVYRSAIHFLDTNGPWRGKRFRYSLPKRTEIAREQANQRLILDLNDSTCKAAITNITREAIKRIENE